MLRVVVNTSPQVRVTFRAIVYKQLSAYVTVLEMPCLKCIFLVDFIWEYHTGKKHILSYTYICYIGIHNILAMHPIWF